MKTAFCFLALCLTPAISLATELARPNLVFILSDGRVSNEPWAFWDYLPTVAELTGAELPPDFHPVGLSLVSFLKGGPAPERDYFYWELHEMSSGSIQAVRWGDWKAVKNDPSGPIEIYDLRGDVGETSNLASARPDLAAKAAELMKSARTEDPNWPMGDKPVHKPRKPAKQ